jgi:hypothetical protein
MKALKASKLVAVLVGILSMAAALYAEPVQGSIFHVDRVMARSTDSYNVVFRAGETARVQVIGDGDTALDLYVYDQNGNLVASDTDYTDDCIVSWTPRWTGVFYIRIVNRGSVYNQYTLQAI